MNARTPVPRPISQIVADIEAQDTRGQMLVLLPSEFRRLLAAARDHHPDALAMASVMPELADRTREGV